MQSAPARRCATTSCTTCSPSSQQRAAQKAGTLSGGQQQMVALARALLNADNRILLVDEPTKGLAPLVVRHVVDALRRAAEATTILLVEQNLSVAHALVRDVVVLDQGRVSFTGDVDQLIGDPGARAPAPRARGRRSALTCRRSRCC